ncbi:hypothetical protein J6590_002384 [Homalodisca vitripennis]|nr:hypothetical protein J6590_002384 [Homalodisca vitripennis]
MNLATGEGTQYQCGRCLRTYRRKEHLRRHERYECSGQAHFQCPHCTKRCSQRTNLQRHIYLKHRDMVGLDQYLLLPWFTNAIRKFTCDKCPRAYCRKEHLRRHQRLECGREPAFQCPHCSKRCSHRSNLTRHVLLVHGEHLETSTE